MLMATLLQLPKNCLVFMAFYAELTELDKNSKFSYWKSEFNCRRKYKEMNRKTADWLG